jgi:hypothetical protein
MDISSVFKVDIFSKIYDFLPKKSSIALISKQCNKTMKEIYEINENKFIETYSNDVTYSVDTFRFKLSKNTYCKAIKKNDDKLLEFLYCSRCPWYRNILIDSLTLGFLGVFLWAFSKDEAAILKKTQMCDIALKNNRLNILKYILENHNLIELCEHAVFYNKPHILIWAKENECEFSNKCYQTAILKGNNTILQWLFDNDGKKDDQVCYIAAENGSLDCLVCARQNGCYWDSSVYNIAITNGHIDCADWCRDNGCPIKKMKKI